MANEIAAATGRRKTAVARVRLFPGTGKWLVNDRELTELFPSEATRNFMVQPLAITNTVEKYDIVAYTSGGGTTGAKNVYISSTTRCTTHIAAGNMVQMVYRVGVAIGTPRPRKER